MAWVQMLTKTGGTQVYSVEMAMAVLIFRFLGLMISHFTITVWLLTGHTLNTLLFFTLKSN